jgi:hypothetical protein
MLMRYDTNNHAGQYAEVLKKYEVVNGHKLNPGVLVQSLKLQGKFSKN